MPQTEQFDSYCLRAERTDVGRKRQANEDNCRNGITINGLVSTVCDGMGGHVGGATASRLAIDAIFATLDSQFYEDPRQAIAIAIINANTAILGHATQHPELTGMGSTCVLMIVRNGKVYIGHVGDSRIYLVRDHRITQLTKDHSYVQMLVDAGEITREQAEHHPRKNEITNALGLDNMEPPTVMENSIIPEPGDCFVLCSDGLSGMVSDNLIAKIAGDHSIHISQRAEMLVNKANEAGGLDNISVELVEFASSPANPMKEEPRIKSTAIPVKVRWALYAVAALVSVLAIIGIYKYCSKDSDVEIKGTDNTSETSLGQPPVQDTEGGDEIQDNSSEKKLDDVFFNSKNNKILTLSNSENGVICKYRDSKLKSQEQLIFDGDTLPTGIDKIQILSDKKTIDFGINNNHNIVFSAKGKNRKNTDYSIKIECKNKTYILNFTARYIPDEPQQSNPSGQEDKLQNAFWKPIVAVGKAVSEELANKSKDK